jgi:hypothetical protein
MPENQRQQAMYVSTGDPETVSDSPARVEKQGGWSGQLGRYVTVKRPGPAGSPGNEDYRDVTYRYVKMDSTMSIAPYKGAVAWWADRTQHIVTTDPTNRGARAGVFQNPPTAPLNVARGDYCYIATGGPATTKLVDAPAAAPTGIGLFVIPSATAGKADTLAAGTAATYPPLGVTTGVWNAVTCEAIVELTIPDTP